jgi:hypothetical protein
MIPDFSLARKFQSSRCLQHGDNYIIQKCPVKSDSPYDVELVTTCNLGLRQHIRYVERVIRAKVLPHKLTPRQLTPKHGMAAGPLAWFTVSLEYCWQRLLDCSCHTVIKMKVPRRRHFLKPRARGGCATSSCLSYSVC